MSRVSGRGMAPALVVALLFPLLACVGDAGIEPSGVLEGRWRLQSIERPQGNITISEPDRFSAEFQSGTLGVRADCNSCGGQYLAREAALEIGSLNCTLILCAGPGTGTVYVGILQAAGSYLVEDGRLTIRSARGVLHFSR